MVAGAMSWNLGEVAQTADRAGAAARARAVVAEIRAVECPLCGDQETAEVGRKPDRARRAHDRSCPVRGPGWRTPARLPRPAWTDPAQALAALMADRWEQRVQLAREMRAGGASYRAIGARFGVSKGTAHHWCNPERQNGR
jgi:hypothetical protein